MSRIKFTLMLALSAALVSACARTDHIGRAPSFDEDASETELFAMRTPGLPENPGPVTAASSSSLWQRDRDSLLGDRRAVTRGDILTVVIAIDDDAEITNSTSRARNASERLGVSSLFGIPQRLDARLPEGASMSDAVSINASSSSDGNGRVRRGESLNLRIAATIVDVLPNGVFAIQGVQQVRVNNEMRELNVSGMVRPGDISRQNEITYDKIASARISYGGRGQISDVQQPRYGQQVADAILPF